MKVYPISPETIMKMPLRKFELFYGFRPETPFEKAVFAYFGGKLPDGFPPGVVEMLWAFNGTLDSANMEETGTAILELSVDEAYQIYSATRFNPNADTMLIDKTKLALIEAVYME